MPTAVKLTEKEAVILELLGDETLYGLELVRASEGRLKAGTVYVTLGRMVEKDLVRSEAKKDPTMSGVPRRLYTATALGRRSNEHAGGEE